MRGHITGKAAAEDEFRKVLPEDPRTVVEAEIGVSLPGGLNLKVHEETNDELHMVLPAPVELTAARLQTVSDGRPTTAGTARGDALRDPDGGLDHD